MWSKSSVGTPARSDSYADDTRAPVMQPAPRGAAHDKLTSKDPLCSGLRSFATRFCFCLSPASHGSNVLERPMSAASSRATSERHNRRPSLARFVGVAGRGIVSGGLIKLAVKRRAADFQSPRDLRHLPAIMRDREADDFGLH